MDYNIACLTEDQRKMVNRRAEVYHKCRLVTYIGLSSQFVTLCDHCEALASPSKKKSDCAPVPVKASPHTPYNDTRIEGLGVVWRVPRIIASIPEPRPFAWIIEYVYIVCVCRVVVCKVR